MINTQQILQDIKRSVHATDPDASVILFGSYARGEQRDDSDMDILVLIDKEKVTHEDRKRIGSPIYRITLDNDILIMPMIYSRNNWNTRMKITPFYKNVITDGIWL